MDYVSPLGKTTSYNGIEIGQSKDLVTDGHERP